MSLVLLILVFWFALTLLMAAGTLFLQGYFNETPPEIKDVLWRAPVASATVTCFVALWVALSVGDPARYAPITEYSSEETSDPPKTLKAVVGGETIEYRLQPQVHGPSVYFDRERARPMPKRPDAVIMKEDGKDIRFEPRKDEAPGQWLRYYDDDGRWMEEGNFGVLTTKRTGNTFVYFLLTVLHLGVWFAAAWPLLRYSVWQSVAITLISWATMVFFVMPPMWQQARKVAVERDKEEKRSVSNHGLTAWPGLPESEQDLSKCG